MKTSPPFSRRRVIQFLMRRSCFSAVLLLTGAGPAVPAGRGGQLLYIGTWPHQIVVFDSAQEKIVDRIELNTDVARTLVLSHDKKKLYANTLNDNAIVTIDLATDKVIGTFSLIAGNRNVRLNGLTPDPGGRYLYGFGATIVKKIDRYDIGPPKFVVIDLVEQKISRTADYPKDESSFGYRSSMKVSPDGKFLYFFRDNILIFDTTDFKLVKKIDLAKPPAPAMENVALNMVDDPNEAPGTVTGFFVSSDPYVHRQVFGIAQIDLAKQSFVFTPIGPAEATFLQPLLLTPDRKVAYTVAIHGAQGNRQCEFWAFDMQTRKLIKKRSFDGRVRFYFGLSADGAKVFIYGAGYQIEVYDAKTFELRSDVDVSGDMTTNMVVLPLGPGVSAASAANASAGHGRHEGR
jgi:hypothetical protein